MNISPAVLGFLRTLLTVAIISVLSYLGDAAHLNGVVSASVATLIAALAMGAEHAIEANTGKALFGAVRV
jgi:hypothetical protein